MLYISGFLLYQNLCCSENCRIGFDTICFVKRLETICEQYSAIFFVENYAFVMQKNGQERSL